MEAKDVAEGLKVLLGMLDESLWDGAMGCGEPVTVGDDLADDRALILRFGDEEFLVTIAKR